MIDSIKAASGGKLWSAGFIYMLFLAAISSISFHIVASILSLHVESLGGDRALGGVVVSTFPITALILRPFCGAIADRFNIKRIITGSITLAAIFLLAHAFTGNIALLIVFRALHGAMFSISSTAIIALATTFIPKDRMGEGIGFLGIGFILAITIGPYIGLVIAEHFDINSVFILSAILTGLSAVMMLFVRYRRAVQTGTAEKFQFRLEDFFDLRLIPLAVFSMLFAFCNGFIQSFIAMMGEERSITNVGVFFTVSAVALVVIRPLSGRLNDKKGIATILIPAYILSAAAMMVLAGAKATWMIALASLLHSFGHGAGQPAIQAECIRSLPDRRGVATSTFFVGLDAGQGLGPLLGGLALNVFSFGTVFTGISVLLLLGVFGFIVYKRKMASI